MSAADALEDTERLAREYLASNAPGGTWTVERTEEPDELRVSEAGTPDPWFVSLSGSITRVGRCRGMPRSQPRTWTDIQKRLGEIVGQWQSARADSARQGPGLWPEQGSSAGRT